MALANATKEEGATWSRTWISAGGDLTKPDDVDEGGGGVGGGGDGEGVLPVPARGSGDANVFFRRPPNKELVMADLGLGTARLGPVLVAPSPSALPRRGSRDDVKNELMGDLPAMAFAWALCSCHPPFSRLPPGWSDPKTKNPKKVKFKHRRQTVTLEIHTEVAGSLFSKGKRPPAH